MSVRFALPLALAALVLAASASAASADPFTGVWAAPDTDGDYVRFSISAPNAEGVRHLAGFDPVAVACDGRPATATGTGTVTGETLAATLTVLCSGTVHYVGVFYFTASGEVLISDTAPAPFTRKGSSG